MATPLISISYRQAMIFVCFFVLYEFLTYIANDMIMPGMIQVVRTFHGQESAVASSLTAYILGGASLQLFLGPLSDCYGRRPVMLWGAVIFLICTVLIGLTQSMEQFLIVRFFQGMGLCFICVVGYATLHEMFSEKDAIRLTSLMANVAIMAPLLGPLAGAVFVHFWSWRLIFVIISVLALFDLWGLWRYMPESVGKIKHDGAKIEPVPLLLKVICANYRALVTDPLFMIAALAFGVLGIPCVVWIALAPIIIVQEAHIAVIHYGLWQLPVFTASIVGNFLLQRLIRHRSIAYMMKMGSLVSIASLVLLWLLPFVFGSDFRWLMPGLIMYFFGYSLVAGPLYRYILFVTAVGKGTAAALNSMFFMVVQAIGIEVASRIYSGHSNVALALYCAVIGLMYGLILICLFHLDLKQANIRPA